MLLLTSSIAKHEFKPLRRFLTIEDLLDGAKKIRKGLAVTIKPPKNMDSFRLFKVRIGKRDGARMIAFMAADKTKVVPILIRLKKDKMFGMNMAMNSLVVVEQITKNVERAIEDIATKEFQEFSLE